MSTIAQQESAVRSSLHSFLSKNLPSTDLEVIDDIVLAYVISVLEEASQDPYFDPDEYKRVTIPGFIEMMEAYIPNFAALDASVVYSWVCELEAELTRRAQAKLNKAEDREDRFSLHLQSLNDVLPSIPTKANRSHSSSESSEGADGECSRKSLVESGQYADECKMLHEMFPNTCLMEIKHCVSIAQGDMERAAGTLLHRRENGQALSAAAIHTATRTKLCDDVELKSRIIARYSYVDKNAESKEHKPLAPKIEPKKMVRYRDNKIVSLKGERYTEVNKSGAEEENLKKPKKPHCP